MLKDQVISVTDLRTKTKQCLEDLTDQPKYIFSNNKMVAVLLNVEEYEALTMPELLELPGEEVTPALRAAAAEARKTPKSKLLNL